MKLRAAAALLATVWICGRGAAQELPSIHDVYAPRPAHLESAWPATTDAAEILERCLVRLREASRLRYDVHVSFPAGDVSGVEEAWGTIALARGEGGRFDRARMTFQGRTASGSSFLVTWLSDGERAMVLDRLRESFAVLGSAEPPGPLLQLVRHASIPGLLPPPGAAEDARFLGRREEGDEPVYAVHFADAEHHEHVYGSFSRVDAWPRSIERVEAGPTGLPGIVRVTVSKLEPDPFLPADTFDPHPPEDYEKGTVPFFL